MGTDVSQLVFIRGNIRQQYLPFVLKPSSNLNANVKDDHDLKDGPQFFSFRNKRADKYKAGFGRLGICPSVMYSPDFEMLFNKDISNRLLYDYNSKDKITIDSFFNQLPAIQIREFQVDARLDQFINLFFELFQATKGLFKEFKLTDMVGMGNDAARSRWFDMVKKVLSTVWDYCMCQGGYEHGPNIMTNEDGSSRWGGKLTSAWDTAVSGIKYALDKEIDLDTYIMDFPFMMYYRLQSCTTTNIYELPYVGEQLWSSNGHEGWAGKEMYLKQLIGEGNKEKSMAGKVLDMIGGFGDFVDRVRINYMPKWDPTGTGELQSLEITFDLFNDTEEAAMKNFIFVNTIIPNNLPMQYGMLRHSPCLYDVKVEGLKRMFLCSGGFTVSSKGLMRTPTPNWIKTLCKKHANQGVKGGKWAGCWESKQLMNDMIDHKLIRIPDVYTVTMKFSSLIPMNFNNFLYNLSKNSKMELYTNKDAHQPSVVGEILSSIKTGLNDEINKVIDEGNSDIAKLRAKEESQKKKQGGGSSVNKK